MQAKIHAGRKLKIDKIAGKKYCRIGLIKLIASLGKS